MRLIAFLLVVICASSAQSAIVQDTLYIVQDSIEVSTGQKLPYITFNETPVFSQTNARIVIDQGDQLELVIVNQDNVTHEVQIKGESGVVSILSGAQGNLNHTFTNAGVFILHDPLIFPDISSVGLSGMIAVKNHSNSSFYWNIKEHKEGNNSTIIGGGNVDWTTYYPEFFTINGNSHPNINLDQSARITGSVGDTLYLYITNTGQSIHPMHFHGYHAEVMYSSKYPSHIGRMKDSQGIYPSEGVVLRIVPDKEGEYPVHDHNLIATTGANLYPMGMFTTILITP